MSTPIALLSVENTGTHFTAGVIKALTGRNVQWATPVNAEAFNTPDIGCMIQHIYPADFLSHADCIVRFMMRADRVVVPMRDPVKAIISNHDRGHRALGFQDHARSFQRALTMPDVHFFQVDAADRENEVQGLADYLGERPKPVLWTPANATPAGKRSDLREWYRRGDFDRLDVALEGAISLLRGFFDLFDPFGYEI